MATDFTTLAAVKAWLNLGAKVEQHSIPNTPGPYTVTVNQSAVWNSDGGVIDGLTGAPMLKVTGAPANAREYAVAVGVYTFNAADKNRVVTIMYSVVSLDDPILTRLITAVSVWIENYLDRTILTASYTAYLDGKGGELLALKNYPVTAVSTVEIDGAVIPSAVGLPTAMGYDFTDYSIVLRGYRFTRGAKNIKVAYTAGFASVPGEIEQACIDLVSYWYRGRGWIGEQSKILGTQNVTYQVKDMPAQVKSVLDSLKRVAPI